ncbi:hypothetical protein ES708_20884 [subsurface metagenome]
MNNQLTAMQSFFDGVSVSSPAPLPKVDPNYVQHTANLDAPETKPFSLSYNPKACTTRFIVHACDCKRHLFPSTCMNLDCIPCQPWTTRRRAFSAFNRLRTERSTVIYTVFTIPFMERYKLTDKKSLTKWRKKAWQILKTYFGARFGVEASHPVGEKTTEFHPHFNFLWVQKSNYQAYINVDMLREKWAVALGATVVNVHSQYSDSPARIMHWSKYVLRTFPGFMHWAGPAKWYGKYPVVPRRDRVVCADCGKPLHAIGYITQIDYDDWCRTGQLTGRSPPWEDDNYLIRFKKTVSQNIA